MREILFRGQRLDNGEWVEGSLVIYNIESIGKTEKIYKISDITQGTFPNDFMSGFEEQVDPITVGQFTGLTDKNGKKIFEADIVKTEYWGICEVGFGEHETCEPDYYSSSAYGWFVKNKREETFSILRETNSCEVVGTIYDKENT